MMFQYLYIPPHLPFLSFSLFFKFEYAYQNKEKSNIRSLLLLRINLAIGAAHPHIIFLSSDPTKQEIPNIPHLLEMLLPDISSHLLAGQDGGGADCIEVDEDQLPDGHAELFKAEVPQLLGLLHDYPIGDVL